MKYEVRACTTDGSIGELLGTYRTYAAAQNAANDWTDSFGDDAYVRVA